MFYKNIAIYYPSLEHFGGIESVIIQQLELFRKAGCICHIITDVPIERYTNEIKANRIVIPQDSNRNANWENIIKSNGIEVVLINGAAFASTQTDINAIHNARIKVVLTIHFSFPSPIIFNEAWDCYKINREIGLLCDAVVTVSNSDAKWWKALGCNAFYVQNPFTVLNNSNENKSKENIIVWVGREAEQKQMFEAIEIISKVKNKIPDIKLRMIGPACTPSIKKLLRNLNIEDNVSFYPNEKSVGQHYEAAKVHLLTSITESFCLVLAEAKSYSIPTVMYSIPFLELVKDGKGIIEVDQYDSNRAAVEIIKLLSDEDYRNNLGSKAKDSLEKFSNENVLTGWNNVFKNLQANENISHKDDDCDIYIRQIYEAWEYQRRKNQFKIDFFEEIKKMTKNDGKSFVSAFMRFIIIPLKNIKRKIR